MFGIRNSSIFLKLLLVLITTALLVNVTVLTVFHFLVRPRPSMHRHFSDMMQEYFSYVAHDLGTPPDRRRAIAFSLRTGNNVIYEDSSGHWSTNSALPPIAALREENEEQRRNFSRGGGPPPPFARHIAIVPTTGGGTYAFVSQDGFPFMIHPESLTFPLFILTLILLGSYVAIRTVLRPVRRLNEGVLQIAAGNLAYEVPVVSHDELGKLAASFNQMTKRIREMIQVKQQLLIDVSHELRSPLARMRVALAFEPSEKRRQQIAEDVAEMDHMIHELLESARLEHKSNSLQLTTTDLSALIHDVVAKHRDLKPGIVFPKPIETPYFVQVDAEKMGSVLRNILGNALKYSDGEKPVELRVHEAAGSFTLEVQDFGIGIPADEIPRLFEPFYRVDKSRSRETGGFGLGLSLCQKIVHAHGGTIGIQSVEGQGTTVTVTIPVREIKE